MKSLNLKIILEKEELFEKNIFGSEFQVPRRKTEWCFLWLYKTGKLITNSQPFR